MALGYGKTDVRAMRNDKGSGSRVKLENEYILGEGKHMVRILPPPTDGPFYFKHYGHYLPSKEYVICPQFTWHKTCPVCVLGNNLFRSRDADEIAQGRKLYRSTAYISNIIDVRNPDQGVLIMRYGVKLRDQFVNFFADPDDEADEGVDITDPTDGATVRITVTPPEGSGGFRQYIASLGKQGPVPYKNWAKHLHDLETIIKDITKSKDELARMISDAMMTDDAPGTESGRSRGNGADEDDDEPAETSMANERKRAAKPADDDDDDEPKQRRKPAVVDEDEDDDDDDQPAPKTAAKSSKPVRRSFPEQQDED